MVQDNETTDSAIRSSAGKHVGTHSATDSFRNDEERIGLSECTQDSIKKEPVQVPGASKTHNGHHHHKSHQHHHHRRHHHTEARTVASNDNTTSKKEEQLPVELNELNDMKLVDVPLQVLARAESSLNDENEALSQHSSVPKDESHVNNNHWSSFAIPGVVVVAAVMAEIIVICAYFAASSSTEFFGYDIEKYVNRRGREISTSAANYFLHDAVVASSGYDTVVSLPELIDSARCSGISGVEIQNLAGYIPDVVDQALRKATTERARIVDYTDDTFEISENLLGSVKAATLSCIIVYGWGEGIKNGAYASQVVTSTLEFPVGSDTSNISMLMEADVVEMGGAGMLFTPKKYCFDLDDLELKGMAEGGADSKPSYSTIQFPQKTVTMNGKSIALTTYGNRVALVTSNRVDSDWTLIQDAYEYPKAELVGLLEAERRGLCPTDEACYNATKQIMEEDFGLVFDPDAAVSADKSLWYLYGILQKWKAYRNEMGLDTLEYIVDGEVVRVTNVSTMAATPFLFDTSIASFTKNALNQWLYPSFTSPYLSQSEFDSKINITKNPGNNLCALESLETSAARHCAQQLPGSILRRRFEFDHNNGPPKENISDWYIDINEAYRGYGYPLNQPYLTQDVVWERDDLTMKSANLTEKRIGRTAKWLMVNDFTNTAFLKNLFAQQESSSDAYSRATADAVKTENKCDEAATNTDIFVLLLAVFSANFGAVKSILESFHYVFNWASKIMWPNKKRAERIQGPATILPTYELGLTIMGGCIFVGLYIPVILQVITEFDIQNYHGSGYDMVIHNSPRMGTDHVFYGAASFVTLVYAETECDEARPFLLLLVLVTGFLVGLLVNLPTLQMTLLVFSRYLNRLRNCGEAEKDVPDYCDVYNRELRILLNHQLQYEHDDNDAEEDHHFVAFCTFP